MLLCFLVVTSPARDVLPIIWTDYTYDSEHDIAEGVPLAFSDTARVPEGEPWLIFVRVFISQIYLKLYIQQV